MSERLDVQAPASACSGYVLGTDSAEAVAAIIAAGGWTGLSGAPLASFTDHLVLPVEGSDTPLFDVARDANDASAGRLYLLAPANGPFVLTLRGVNDWAAYYYPNGVAAGTLISFDIPGLQDGALSRASIYADAASIGPVTGSVPEPSSLGSAAAGLAAWLAALGRRRHTSGPRCRASSSRSAAALADPR